MFGIIVSIQCFEARLLINQTTVPYMNLRQKMYNILHSYFNPPALLRNKGYVDLQVVIIF